MKTKRTQRRRTGKPGEQLPLKGTSGWGGRRKGAGRKRSDHPRTPHRVRPRHYHGHPVHVTLRAGLSSLRSRFLFPTVRLAIARATRRDPENFRIVAFSVQANHVHLIVESTDRRFLSAGVRGLAVRLARHVNEVLMRKGPLWADRWHGRALKSPREVRQALVYVFANFRKHGGRSLPPGIDPCSSAEWFDGFVGYHPGRDPPPHALPVTARAALLLTDPVAPPRGYLLTIAWRRNGLIGIDEAPAGPRTRRGQARAPLIA